MHAEYPENGVVIDNPPFSIFTKICGFYTANNIPFFLFGPGMTILSCVKYCSAVFVSDSIKFENGAVIRCNFATNMIGDVVATTAPRLAELISACKSQQKPKLKSYTYPIEVLRVSEMNCLCAQSVEFQVNRSQCKLKNKLDGIDNYGCVLLLSKKKAKEKEEAIKFYLSEKEIQMIKELDRKENETI